MIRLHGFRGGLTGLPGNKEVSTSMPVQRLAIPERLYLPISGVDSLTASIGDRVIGGQQLTNSAPGNSAIWHAPVAGRLVEVVDHPAPHVSGQSVPTLVLEPDGSDEMVDYTALGWSGVSFEELFAVVEAAGIIGMGGAGFPTCLKLSGAGSGMLSTLIINGVECEPEISCDDMLMREQSDKVVAATAKLAALLQVDKAYIAVEDDCPQALSRLAASIQSVKEIAVSAIELVKLPIRYPSGSEKQLIENLLGKQVPKGGFPSDIGVLCLNVATLCAVDDAVTQGIPLMSRIVTVTGDAVAKPQNRRVLFGTAVADLLSSCGGLIAEVDDLVMGGPMMGFALSSPLTPIVKTSNCILVQRAPVLGKRRPIMPCIRCGDCVDVCPAGLLPQQLYWFAKSGEHDKAERHNLFDCIECGACAYVCPSQLPLVHYYRAAKSEIRTQWAQLIKADGARERMQARDERLERREQEAAERRLRKRSQRKISTDNAEPPMSAEVKAAMARAKKLQQAGASETSEKSVLADKSTTPTESARD
ncbi:MAG: electron transport complex subunit RsxC [Gammaproteobacteria bacterium]|nr:MAG: electron transport complex subunit RsxC [Gammaproteobacteria bacterium]RLA13463.1 MAG: electron transport complex subunit RsxC [Gammaproteobacteria bacterium]